MTPLLLAHNLAKSDNPADRILATAIVTRGLTDDDELRQGWPMSPATVRRAISFLGLQRDESDGFIAAVIEAAPSVSDAMLNKGAATR